MQWMAGVSVRQNIKTLLTNKASPTPLPLFYNGLSHFNCQIIRYNVNYISPANSVWMA